MKTCPQCQIKYPDVLEFCPRDGAPLPAASTSSAATYDPILDTTIDGRYAIEARLGEGGMGVVYKARHVLIDKPVAIKILRKEAAQDTAAVQRFIQEAKSASKINQFNIVDITDFGVLADGHAYFVMEFLQGPTLSQAIQEGPLEPARVCLIGAQMARGLHAAHTKGIVHRDLKPENIFLLEREGQKDFVKIVDFGIAKVGGGQKLTQVGMVLGTPEYMSPEQATGQETDPRVDQYAVGCIMYEMLTGTVPYLGERPAQTLTKHVFEPLVAPRKRKPELNIPAALDAVVVRTLAKKPEQRFPSMRELEQALTQVEGELRAGRIVVDDPRMVVPPSSRSTPPSGSAMLLPPPSGQSFGQSHLPGTPMSNGAVPQQVFAQPSAPIYAPPGVPVLGPPVAPQFPYPPGGVMPSPREHKLKRVRRLLAAVAGGLLVIIGLLIYFLLKSPSDQRDGPQLPRTGDPGNLTVPTSNPDLADSKVSSPSTHPSSTTVEVNITSRPAGAEVYIDGEMRGATPYKLSQRSGLTVRLEVRRKGFESYIDDLTFTKDQEVAVKLEKERGGKKGSDGKRGSGSGSGSGSGNKDKDKGNNGKTLNKTLKEKDTPPSTQLPSGLRDPFKRKP